MAGMLRRRGMRETHGLPGKSGAWTPSRRTGTSCAPKEAHPENATSWPGSSGPGLSWFEHLNNSSGTRAVSRGWGEEWAQSHSGAEFGPALKGGDRKSACLVLSLSPLSCRPRPCWPPPSCLCSQVWGTAYLLQSGQLASCFPPHGWIRSGVGPASPLDLVGLPKAETISFHQIGLPGQELVFPIRPTFT